MCVSPSWLKKKEENPCRGAMGIYVSPGMRVVAFTRMQRRVDAGYELTSVSVCVHDSSLVLQGDNRYVYVRVSTKCICTLDVDNGEVAPLRLREGERKAGTIMATDTSMNNGQQDTPNCSQLFF